jgi:hypothetical protein
MKNPFPITYLKDKKEILIIGIIVNNYISTTYQLGLLTIVHKKAPL